MNKLLKNVSLVAAMLVLFTVASATGNLKVGFSEVDITPPVGTIITGPNLPVSIGVEDPLYARALVVQDDDQTLAIVGVDLVKIRDDLAHAAILIANYWMGIDPDAVMICPSHNHSSPWVPYGGSGNADYLDTLPWLIAESITNAYHALEEAEMYVGRSMVYEGHKNRRVISRTDGRVINTWYPWLNSLERTPQALGTEGPIDPELWVVRFNAMDNGDVLGTLVNFSNHPVVRDRDTLKTFSADYPGVIAGKIKDQYGNQAVCVFMQGASGNISPPKTVASNWYEKAEVFADAAVEAAVGAIKIDEPIAVGYARSDLLVPRRDPAEQSDEEILRLGLQVEDYVDVLEWVANMPEMFDVPVSAMRIGPFSISSNPGELFVEWGLYVKQHSPFTYNVVSELVNAWIGYEPTELGFQNGGYETLVGVNLVTLEGIQTMVDTNLALLQELWDVSPPPVPPMTLQCEDYRDGANAPGGVDSDYTVYSYYDSTPGSQSGVDYLGRNAAGSDVDFAGLSTPPGARTISYISFGEWWYMSGDTASPWTNNPVFSATARYKITGRVASANTAVTKYFEIWIDGVLEATVPVEYTGGTSEAFYEETVGVTTTSVIAEGEHVVKFNGASGNYNIDWVKFETVPAAAAGYEAWASSYSLVEPETGDDDDDGLSNIYEYGLDGDPTNVLDQGTSPVFEVDGGNCLYVHPQRSDDDELVYSLALSTNLVLGNWMTNSGYAVTGTNVTGNELDFVTNATDTSDIAKFIRLIIE